MNGSFDIAWLAKPYPNRKGVVWKSCIGFTELKN